MRLYLPKDVLGGLDADDTGKLAAFLKEKQSKEDKAKAEREKRLKEAFKAAPQGTGLPSYQAAPTTGSDQAFKGVQDAYGSVAESAGKLGGVRVDPVKTEAPSDLEAIGLPVFDFLSQLASRAPARERQYRSSLGALQGLRDEKGEKELRDRELEAGNERNRLSAELQSNQARLEAALKGTDFALAKEGAAREESRFKYGTEFDAAKWAFTVGQAGISNALAMNAEERSEESAAIENALRKNPYAFVSETAEAIKDQFGGDAGKAKAALMSDLILGSQINQATLDKLLTEVGMTKAEAERQKALFALITPQKEAQHQLWQMEFEVREGDKRMKLLDAQIASSNRANRDPTAAEQLKARQLSEIDAQITRLRGRVDDYDKAIATGRLTYKNYVVDPEVTAARDRDNERVGELIKKANAIQPGYYPE